MRNRWNAIRRAIPATAGAMLAAGLATAAAAETDMEKALARGAVKMSSDGIAERLAGKTVTFENATSGAKVLVHYDGGNGIVLKPLGSNDELEGFYAVDLADHVCFGIRGDKPMRLRCVNVLLMDGRMHKFELDGSLRGRVVHEAEGKQL